MNMQMPAQTVFDGSASPASGGFVVSVHRTPRDIEPDWRALERDGAGTVFQRFDWVDAYARTVAAQTGIEVAILAGRLGGELAFVLPLAIARSGMARIAGWLGGSHAGYNFGLWSDAGLAAATGLGRSGLTRLIGRALPGVDGAVLRQIPFELDGQEQPLAALAHLPSAVMGYSLSLSGGMDDVIARTGGGARRRRARSKERRMAETGPVEQGFVAGGDAIDAALDFFAEHKAQRLAEQGMPNVFAEAGVMDFFREMARSSVGQREPLLQLSHITVGDRMRAIIGSGVHRGRVNLYILTYAKDELLPHSPGQVLMYRHVEESCAAGHSAFDFGVGYELYKESWADARIPLFDAYAAFTARGTAAIAATRLQDAAKNAVRGNERIRSLLKSLRGRRGEAQGTED